MKNRALVLLSGEGTTLPSAEAKALFLAYDQDSKFESPHRRILIADSRADPLRVGSRIAFARRVGRLVESRAEAAGIVEGHRVRFRSIDVRERQGAASPEPYMEGLDVTVDLDDPEYELTVVRGDDEYFAVTAPTMMKQGWSMRRPRKRPFFHPAAIFPKLSRALVNLTRCREGEVFLDPFCGTGSIPIEAHVIGARVLAADIADNMVRGALRNMKHFGQDWLGVIRADAGMTPIRGADAVATDIPYGRASSARGRAPKDVMEDLVARVASLMSSGSLLVVMHPQTVPAPESRELHILEEHHLHVHKLLTRTITVLGRR
ncbi:MAG: hypothetical protein JRM80_08035 [Nitrososphaerota archaeon]|nr:hypothetical protein [Nitrososphaerota archaeon]